ncbi:hypothetical protein BDZ89DRAFT_1114533 [Hymenopellis radicata]|nr:hypothetical protein BDZ89DRAFT_1114533 [Hymenopellis radicata]
MFSFTFKLAVPGLANPFSPPSPSTSAVASTSRLSQTSPSDGDIKAERLTTGRGRVPSRRQRPRSNSPAPPPLTRKRGWEPSYPEPSLSTTTLASSSGYLDTPAKYRDLAQLTPDEYHEIQAMTEELPPPAKRRRGLAGSIVSTAVSAALIGTAVGLTVYRMWRDRGKEQPQEQLAPPPYYPGEWAPESRAALEAPKAINVIPPTPRRKTRQHAVGSLNRRTTASRKLRPRMPAFTPPPPSSYHQSTSTSSHRGNSPDDNVDDQMDWLGDKLAALIEEGKKALGREVVVMSEAPEDEVDDGTDAWEEEDDGRPSSPRRAKQPRGYGLPPSYSSPSTSASPRSSRFDLSSAPIPIAPRSREKSADSGIGMTPRFGEDERAWESPMLRESMEQARARALKNRGLA